MNDRKTYKLETPLGNVFLTPTSDKHIFVDAGSNLNVADEYPLGTRKGPLTVYTVGYAVSAHYYRHPDGWQLGEPGGDDALGVNKAMRAYNALYMSRYPGNSFKETSNAARRKAINVLTPLINEWVTNNPAAMKAAQISALETSLDNVVEEMSKTAAKQEALREEYERISGQLDLLDWTRFRLGSVSGECLTPLR